MQIKYDRNATALATLRIAVGVFFVLFGPADCRLGEGSEFRRLTTNRSGSPHR
jgi:hypothetical protein